MLCRPLNLVAVVALALSACTTSYKVAPSTAKVSTRVAVAKESARSAERHTVAAKTKTVATQTASKGVTSNIDAALGAIETKDYTQAAQFLIAAKVGSAVVQAYLEQTLVDLEAARSNFGTVDGELTAAEGEIKTLQDKIDRQAVDGADDAAIAKRCKSWFGLGAIFYGIERLLKAGIVGILILAGVAIALVAIGGPVGAFALKGVRWFFGLFRKTPS